MLFSVIFALSVWYSADMGAAVALSYCSPVIFQSQFLNNTAAQQGGAMILGIESGATIYGTSVFAGNMALVAGGAITQSGSALLSLNAVSFTDNSAVVRAGALEIAGASALQIDGTSVRFSRNAAPTGGAIWWYENGN